MEGGAGIAFFLPSENAKDHNTAKEKREEGWVANGRRDCE